MDHPRPWLRYVDAGDLDDSTTKLDGMTVESPRSEKLGTVDGFIIDTSSARPYYVVVNGGGWFKSKFFLLPIGHVSLGGSGRSLVADVARERIERYPGFDRDEFEKLDDNDLRRMDEQMMAACCPSEIAVTDASWRLDSRRHYQAPSWWDAGYYRPDRADASIAGATAAAASVRTPRTRAAERESVVASASDVRPEDNVRAQPGDVLGLDTNGERTYVGDTAEDEDKRREDAQEAARKLRGD